MFLESCGEVIRVLCGNEEGNWVISYDNPCTPKFVLRDDLRSMEHIEPPKDFQMRMTQEQTPGQKKRQKLISELLEEESYVWDRTGRNTKIREIAAREKTSERRIRELYFRALAGRALVEERKKAEKEETKEEKDFLWAIDTFYYTAKKFSLRSAYDMLLLSRYTDPDGHLLDVYPSWNTFRHYFYDKNFHKKSRKLIARNGLTDYQRNERPLFGSASAWKEQIGVFQMDATQADIYLVSRLDRSEVLGRPYIYLAVDTATQLIAGVYVGMDAGEQAVINCLSNAAADKVSFCKRYGLDIKKEEWPNTGLPGEIITDKGMLWSSFFVTLVAKKIVLINLCCRPCFIWGSITIITVWTNMIIINVCKFFYLLIECFLCCKLIQICAFILQGIEITLHRCIVVRIPCFAHALCHIYRFAEFGKCFGRIL